MTIIHYGPNRRRAYIRKFDWDEARYRFSLGESISDLAKEYGVTYTAVHNAVTPGAYEKLLERGKKWAKGTEQCTRCNAPVNRVARRNFGSKLCVQCARDDRMAIYISRTVREHELYCRGCNTWKVDEDFGIYKRAPEYRRGRHFACKVCCATARRDRRHRAKRKANS